MSKYFLFILILILYVTLIACEPDSGSHDLHDHDSHEMHEDEEKELHSRTEISADIAHEAGIVTSVAGPETIKESITVYGEIIANPEKTRKVSARFDGVIQSMHASIGDTVKKGQTLAKIESNESLSVYAIKAPISGTITQRLANTGEYTDGGQLFTIIDNSTVWVELQIFPKDRLHIKQGDEVIISIVNDDAYTGLISNISTVADAVQVVTAHAVFDNSHGVLIPGTYVNARINIAQHAVPLAVKRTAIQQFHDRPVVYVQFGEEYEVRVLELGRQDEHWVEVLSGLESGTNYVSENSYVVKADIEKAGAAHHH